MRCSPLARLVAVAGLVATVTVAAVAAGGAVPAHAITPTPAVPAGTFSITVDNGVKEAGEGDTRTYQVKVRNLGESATPGATVRLNLPGHATVGRAEGGKAEMGALVWTPDLAPGKEVTLSATVTYGKAPAGLKGVAVVACVVMDAVTQVCGTDMDQIPGAEDIHATVPIGGAVGAGSVDGGPSWVWWLVAGVIGVVACVLALVLVRRGRRRGASRDEGLDFADIGPGRHRQLARASSTKDTTSADAD